MITGLIVGASILAAARIIANALASKGNAVTRTSRHKRATRTWDALANESTSIGDNDRTSYFPTYRPGVN